MKTFVPEPGQPSNVKFKDRVRIVPGDITKQSDVDAIVTTLPINMDVEGSINQSLIRAAGAGFDEFMLENIIKPRPWDVYVLPGMGLPVKHVIVVITPDMRDPVARQDVFVLRTYRLPLKMAASMRLRKIAFPPLVTGRRGLPLPRAARLGVRGIMERMVSGFEEVRVVCDDPEVLAVFQERLDKYGNIAR